MSDKPYPFKVHISQKPSPVRLAAQQRSQLHEMAAKVQDEAHWQSILKTAETDEQREELERVVGPLLHWRKPSTACTTPECSSDLGVWQPVLVVASPLDPEVTSWVPIELRLCEACKADAVLADFMTDHIWRQVLDAWPHNSVPPPVRRLTTLQWDRIH